jgi:hypothetical protein
MLQLPAAAIVRLRRQRIAQSNNSSAPGSEQQAFLGLVGMIVSAGFSGSKSDDEFRAIRRQIGSSRTASLSKNHEELQFCEVR